MKTQMRRTLESLADLFTAPARVYAICMLLIGLELGLVLIS
jgi:hypothetical protein